MVIVKEKISVQHLQIGMYICELDRSWLDTPFPFQGFYIRSKTEIADVQRFCEYVYIDVEKGKGLPVESALSKPSPLLDKKNQPKKTYTGTSRPVHIRIGHYGEKLKPIKREFTAAHNLLIDLTQAFEETSFNLRVGKKLDIRKTKALAKNLVACVIRNPNTLVWLTQLKQKGDYTYNHSLRCAVLSTVFGRHLGLSETDLHELATGMILADIGKTKISRKLLNKTEKISDKEKELFKSHVELGVEILGNDKTVGHTALIIAETHHERFDGTGYPYGLVGKEIPLFGQIAGIVDTFDAMTSKKSYGKQHTTSQAMDWLYQNRNKKFDGELVDEFIQAVGLYPAGSMVELSDNSIGLVLSHNKSKRLKPEVLLIKDSNSKFMEKPKYVDLSKKGVFTGKDKPMVTRNVVAESININGDALLNAFLQNRRFKQALLG